MSSALWTIRSGIRYRLEGSLSDVLQRSNLISFYISSRPLFISVCTAALRKNEKV